MPRILPINAPTLLNQLTFGTTGTAGVVATVLFLLFDCLLGPILRPCPWCWQGEKSHHLVPLIFPPLREKRPRLKCRIEYPVAQRLRKTGWGGELVLIVDGCLLAFGCDVTQVLRGRGRMFRS